MIPLHKINFYKFVAGISELLLFHYNLYPIWFKCKIFTIEVKIRDITKFLKAIFETRTNTFGKVAHQSSLLKTLYLN